VPKIIEVSKVDRLEVLGNPGAEATGILRQFGAEIYSDWQP